VDILVNNAGLTRDSLFVFMDSASWKDVLSVNLTEPSAFAAWRVE
jgi:3-oxoacyl-[acyl-carrier protein] reductase